MSELDSSIEPPRKKRLVPAAGSQTKCLVAAGNSQGKHLVASASSRKKQRLVASASCRKKHLEQQSASSLKPVLTKAAEALDNMFKLQQEIQRDMCEFHQTMVKELRAMHKTIQGSSNTLSLEHRSARSVSETLSCPLPGEHQRPEKSENRKRPDVQNSPTATAIPREGSRTAVSSGISLEDSAHQKPEKSETRKPPDQQSLPTANALLRESSLAAVLSGLLPKDSVIPKTTTQQEFFHLALEDSAHQTPEKSETRKPPGQQSFPIANALLRENSLPAVLSGLLSKDSVRPMTTTPQEFSRLALDLASTIIGNDVLAFSSLTGTRGTKRLSVRKLNEIKAKVQQQKGQGLTTAEFGTLWLHCLAAIGNKCETLRKRTSNV